MILLDREEIISFLHLLSHSVAVEQRTATHLGLRWAPSVLCCSTGSRATWPNGRVRCHRSSLVRAANLTNSHHGEQCCAANSFNLHSKQNCVQFMVRLVCLVNCFFILLMSSEDLTCHYRSVIYKYLCTLLGINV